MMKNQKGITLIALVITIIVLLILAGVSIAMLTGENGILSQATEAGSETKIAEAKELVTLAINEVTAEFYEEKYVNNNTDIQDKSTTVGDYVVQNVASRLDDKIVKTEVTGTGATATIKFTTVAVDNDGNASTATYSASTGTIGDGWTEVKVSTDDGTT